MTVILRLQGLDVRAGTEDIRTFFRCLHIPDGGVYIVGGSLREAFIAFATTRDAQLAMRFSGNFLKGSEVTLHISSMEELEHKLKSLLKTKNTFPTHNTVKRPQPSPDANLSPLNAEPHTPSTSNLPPTTATKLDGTSANLPQLLYPSASNVQDSNAVDPNMAFLLGICTALQGLQSNKRENDDAMPGVDFPKTEVVSNEVRTPEQTLTSEPGYVRLFGLPATATKEDICHFFKGLTVQEAIVNVKLGLGRGCLVKFASVQEACDALLFNQQPLGLVCVEVRGATEKMWTSALQECENAFGVEERARPKQSPPGETASHNQQIKRQSLSQLLSNSPKRPRDTATALLPTVEYTVMVSNLPKTMTKTEIKELLGCPNIAHKNILHLLDKERNRTDTAFIILNNTVDYNYAMNLTGCHVGSDTIEVSSITKKIMRDMMAKTQSRSLGPGKMKKPHRKRKTFGT